MATVTALMPVACMADPFVRPILLDEPEVPARLTGRLELRVSGPDTATLLLHARYDGEGDELRGAMHAAAFRHLRRCAAELDPEPARRRSRLNHPSMAVR